MSESLDFFIPDMLEVIPGCFVHTSLLRFLGRFRSHTLCWIYEKEEEEDDDDDADDEKGKEGEAVSFDGVEITRRGTTYLPK